MISNRLDNPLIWVRAGECIADLDRYILQKARNGCPLDIEKVEVIFKVTCQQPGIEGSQILSVKGVVTKEALDIFSFKDANVSIVESHPNG